MAIFGSPQGADKIVCYATQELHCPEKYFVVPKFDMTNAFNLVSRQVALHVTFLIDICIHPVVIVMNY